VTSGERSTNSRICQVETVPLVKLDMVVNLRELVDSPAQDTMREVVGDMLEELLPILEVAAVVHAVNVALEVAQDQLDLPAQAESPETQDLPEAQASPESHQAHHALHQLLLHANHAQEVNQDHKDHPVPVANPAVPDSQERAAETQLPDHQVHPAPTVSQDRQENPVAMDNQASPARRAEDKVHQGQLEMLEPQDNPEAQDNPVETVNQAVQDQKDLQAVQENQAMTAILANQEALDNLAVAETRVSAPNTALSMEESSSRMELVVVKRLVEPNLSSRIENCLSILFVLLICTTKSSKICGFALMQ